MHRKLLRFYRYLGKNWNAIAATVGVLGVLITSFIPQMEKYITFFLFILGSAIIFTLIEIKTELFRRPRTTRYDNMRAARDDILRSIREAMGKTNPKDVLNIQIVGGRIRTISDMVREIKNDVLARRVRSENVIISIYCLDPNFVASWQFECIKDEDAFKQRASRYAGMIKQFTDELIGFNALPEFSKNRISIEVYHYRTLPFFYGYFIGQSLFWGFFTWNTETEDFEGPENPCFFLDSKDEHFIDIRRWLLNRTECLKTIVGSRYREVR